MRTSNGLVAPGMRYRAVTIRRFPVGAGLELVTREQDHVGIVVRPEVASLLEATRSVDVRDAHVARIERALAGTALQAVDAAALCDELCRVGLLETERAFLERCRLVPDRPPSSGPGRIGAIGWITCDRHDALARSVASYLTHIRARARPIEAVVVDDSPGVEAQARNQDRLRSIARSLGIDIRYSGRVERAAYGHALATRADVPTGLVDFALGDPLGCGCSIGAARNTLLLDALGHLVLSADDDTVCAPTSHPEGRDVLRLYGTRDPTDIWPFLDRPSALAAAPAADLDLLAAHETALGRPFADLVREALARRRLSWGPLSADDVQLLEAGRGHVAVTMTGVLGDSGMPTHGGLLWGLDEPSRSRVIGDEGLYRIALTSREVLRVAPALSVGARSHCAGTAYGFDNRSLVPPFMPVRRNEDGVFAALLTAAHHGAVFAHLPIALVHDAPARARHPPIDAPMAQRQLGDILLLCIWAGRPPVGWQSAADGLERIGSHLQEIGALRPDELQRFLRLQLAAQASVFFAVLESVRREHGGKPAYWAADLDRCAHAAREALQHPDAIVPRDLRAPERGRDDVFALTREVIRRFGELLCAWPQVVDAARELRDAGIRPSRRLGR